jgi:HPr kinase/phosphorylase
MSRISIQQMYSDNKEDLNLSCDQSFIRAQLYLDHNEIKQSSRGLIGHLNLIHPNWIQIFSKTEAAYFAELCEDDQCASFLKLERNIPLCFLISDGEVAPKSLSDFASRRNIPLIKSPLSSLQLIWGLRTYLGRALAEHVTQHGVFLDVLGVGVLIIGESGVGKSELALELISRGSGLVADDVVELFHIGPKTLEGRSPELLKDFLEVRGLGMLNIKTIFGETAVRRRKNLKLIVKLEKPDISEESTSDRLPLHASNTTILDVEIRTVTLPVAAGRNLAVLVEAAVRNYVLQTRGIDNTAEFIQRQEKQMRQ